MLRINSTTWPVLVELKDLPGVWDWVLDEPRIRMTREFEAVLRSIPPDADPSCPPLFAESIGGAAARRAPLVQTDEEAALVEVGHC